MKRLGAGWQYAAYDLGNGRVLKRRRGLVPQMGKIALGLLYGKQLSYRMLNAEQKRSNKSAEESIKYIERIPVPERWMLGNPVFKGLREYEQDKVRTLHDLASESSPEDMHRLIDAYIALLQDLWEYGLSETSFNFMWNAGMNSKNQMVLIDFGELATEREVVAEQIRTLAWLKQYVFRYFKGETSVYLAKALEERLTLERLDALWGKKLIR